jgi:hypothetical protein
MLQKVNVVAERKMPALWKKLDPNSPADWLSFDTF